MSKGREAVAAVTEQVLETATKFAEFVERRRPDDEDDGGGVSTWEAHERRKDPLLGGLPSGRLGCLGLALDLVRNFGGRDAGPSAPRQTLSVEQARATPFPPPRDIVAALQRKDRESLNHYANLLLTQVVEHPVSLDCSGDLDDAMKLVQVVRQSWALLAYGGWGKSEPPWVVYTADRQVLARVHQPDLPAAITAAALLSSYPSNIVKDSTT